METMPVQSPIHRLRPWQASVRLAPVRQDLQGPVVGEASLAVDRLRSPPTRSVASCPGDGPLRLELAAVTCPPVSSRREDGRADEGDGLENR